MASRFKKISSIFVIPVSLFSLLLVALFIFPLPLETLKKLTSQLSQVQWNKESILNGQLDLNILSPSVLTFEKIVLKNEKVHFEAEKGELKLNLQALLSRRIHLTNLMANDVTLVYSLSKSPGIPKEASSEQGTIFDDLVIDRMRVSIAKLTLAILKLQNTDVSAEKIEADLKLESLPRGENLSLSGEQMQLSKIKTKGFSIKLQKEDGKQKVDVELPGIVSAEVLYEVDKFRGPGKKYLAKKADVIVRKIQWNDHQLSDGSISLIRPRYQVEKEVLAWKKASLFFKKLELFDIRSDKLKLNLEEVNLNLGKANSYKANRASVSAAILRLQDDVELNDAELKVNDVNLRHSSGKTKVSSKINFASSKTRLSSATLDRLNLRAKIIDSHKFDLALDSEFPEVSLSVKGTLENEASALDASFELQNLNIKQSLRLTGSQSKEKVLIEQGFLNGTGDLKLSFGSPLEELNGNLQLKGKDIIVNGFDLDSLLDHYVRSTNFNLLDVAGFFTLGPLGLLASKGVNLGSSIPSAVNGQTQLKYFELETEVRQSKALVKKAKASLAEYDLKAKGGLDLAGEQSIDIKVAPLSKEGCAHFVQEIRGSLKKPEISEMKTLVGNVLAPVSNLFKKVGRVFGKDCHRF